MRLIIRVARAAAVCRDYGDRFARAIAELVKDGHFLAVIHGEGAGVEPLAAAKAAGNGNGNGGGYAPDQAECQGFIAAERESRALPALPAEADVIAIGLRATDAGLVQLRRQHTEPGSAVVRAEAARLNPRRLELICGNKGVPVLSNLSSWSGDEGHLTLIDPDRMAAVCAAHWNADALICVTEENGVPGAQGGILRWLDIESGSGPRAETLSPEMRGRLEACGVALRHGVRRVRILPLSNVDCLSLFYVAPIEYGTEVIASARRI